MSLLDKFASVLAPHECLGCGAEGNLLCPVCLTGLPRAPQLRARNLNDLQAATLYQGLAKQLIWKLKSGGAQAAAAVMAAGMADLIDKSSRPLVVSVPTATARARQRGYDQARLLGRELARQGGLPWLDCLARSGQLHQVGANRERRRRQMHDSLRVTQTRFVRGAHIVLVDDVVTTGATFEAAAKVLKTAGASRVDGLAFAFTPSARRTAT